MKNSNFLWHADASLCFVNECGSFCKTLIWIYILTSNTHKAMHPFAWWLYLEQFAGLTTKLTASDCFVAPISHSNSFYLSYQFILQDTVRKLAKNFDLPNQVRKDSQGICFLGKVCLEKKYHRFGNTCKVLASTVNYTKIK